VAAQLERLEGAAFGLGQLTAAEGPHSPPQRHVPAIQGVAVQARHPVKSSDLLVDVDHAPELTQRDDTKAAAQQLERPITGGAGEGHDLSRRAETLAHVIRPSDSVTAAGERSGEGGGIPTGPSEDDRLVGQLQAPVLGADEREGD
jgi:hypothetical protein